MPHPSRRPVWQIIIAWSVGLPVLYVATFGPMARLAQDGYLGNGAFQTLFAPLMWMMHKSPAWMNILGGYQLLCGVRLG